MGGELGSDNSGVIAPPLPSESSAAQAAAPWTSGLPSNGDTGTEDSDLNGYGYIGDEVAGATVSDPAQEGGVKGSGEPSTNPHRQENTTLSAVESKSTLLPGQEIPASVTSLKAEMDTSPRKTGVGVGRSETEPTKEDAKDNRETGLGTKRRLSTPLFVGQRALAEESLKKNAAAADGTNRGTLGRKSNNDNSQNRSRRNKKRPAPTPQTPGAHHCTGDGQTTPVSDDTTDIAEDEAYPSRVQNRQRSPEKKAGSQQYKGGAAGRAYLSYLSSDDSDGEQGEKLCPTRGAQNRQIMQNEKIAGAKHGKGGGRTEAGPAYLSYLSDDDNETETNIGQNANPQAWPNQARQMSGPGAFPRNMNGRSDENLPSYYFGLGEASSEQLDVDLGFTTTGMEDTGGLAVANPVEEKSGVFAEEAQEIDMSESLKREAEVKRRALIRTGILILVGLILIVGATVTAVLLTREDNTNANDFDGILDQDNGTDIPSLLSLEEQVLLLLPTQTVDAITTDSATAQAKAFQWLVDDPSLLDYPDWRKVQRFALATFFFATNGDLWRENTNWLSYDHNECTWYTQGDLGLAVPAVPEVVKFGLIDSFPTLFKSLCGREEVERVEQIVLVTNELEGSLPPELFLLTDLKVFVSVSNLLGGTIPATIASASSLEFFAAIGKASVGLEGKMPSEVGLAKNLTHLVLINNKLTGSIPSEFGSLLNLEATLLDDNGFSGTIPTEIGLLSQLFWISCFNNKLSGALPTELGQLSSVRLLGIKDNLLVGHLPSELGLLTAIQDLHFGYNAITGPIPSEVGQMSSLLNLYLFRNLLSSKIPSELFMIQNLSKVEVDANSLTGMLPTELGLMKSFRELQANGNFLTGPIPTELWNVRTLQKIRVWDNGFTGSIPSEIAQLESLTYFQIQQNKMTGTLPTELFTATTRLDRLSFSQNALTGSIPTEIGLAPNLGQFLVHGNQMTGPLPTEVGECTLLTNLRLANNSFTGEIPSQLGLLLSLERLSLHSNLFSGNVPVQLAALQMNVNVSGNLRLNGSVPEALCPRQCGFATCQLEFDCNEDLCGCDSCPCPG